MEEFEHVMECLRDVLRKEKMLQVSEEQVLEELEKTKGLDGEKVNHTYQYHPLRSVDTVVSFFVNKFTKGKHQTEDELEDSEEDIEDTAGTMFEPSQDFLRSLCVVYPDIDPQYLDQICQRFGNSPEDIQTFLDENSAMIPARRQVQSVQFRMLQSQHNPHTEELWQCPDCRAWQIIERGTFTSQEKEVACKEVVSCGKFCARCNRRSHQPFACRNKSVRAIQEEDEVDIFKRLTASADEIRATVKIFKMVPKNDVNYSDPLDILYSMAESTFLRMLRWSASFYGNTVTIPQSPTASVMGAAPTVLQMNAITNRNAINCINYIENEILKERFMDCKKRFQAKGIPDGERLVFHGTKRTNLDSIMEQGLLLSKCKRKLHGHGIYLSEFPDVSQVYGHSLLLVRVMLGRPYQGSELKVPEGFHSKLIHQNSEGNCKMILIENEEQILPAFHIQVNW